MNSDTNRLDPGFDPRIAEWLETDPDRAPGEVLDTILAALPSVAQRRAFRGSWRFPEMFTPSRVALAAVIGVLLVGGAFLASTRPSDQPSVGATPSPSVVATPSPVAQVDYSDLPGRILAEHLGNAIDGSEMPTTDYNPDRRRLYLMDPKTMTGASSVEFLPGQPATGKSAADVSADGTKVVFQDWTTPTRLYEANLDGTGFHQIAIDCTCSLLYPDFDPTATRIVYVRVQGSQSWLEIRDLSTDATTKLDKTVGSSTDDVPEQPAWSPDGRTIAFSRLHWGGKNDPVVGTVRYGDVAPTSGVLSLVNVATGAVSDLPIDPAVLPGDANWSPDSRTILFSTGPASTTGSVGAEFGHTNWMIGVDGTGLKPVRGFGSPSYLPDGEHILYQDNVFMIVSSDGSSEALPVNAKGIDLSDLPQGFVYVGHWIPAS
jgi:hypothetical protein